ncbi:hypothetical protein QJS66_04435 [Kocuria rhizophila]|nr:hypothetical protein QJS66_04435 [Kocuria rhizophila]
MSSTDSGAPARAARPSRRDRRKVTSGGATPRPGWPCRGAPEGVPQPAVQVRGGHRGGGRAGLVVSAVHAVHHGTAASASPSPGAPPPSTTCWWAAPSTPWSRSPSCWGSSSPHPCGSCRCDIITPALHRGAPLRPGFPGHGHPVSGWLAARSPSSPCPPRSTPSRRSPPRAAPDFVEAGASCGSSSQLILTFGGYFVRDPVLLVGLNMMGLLLRALRDQVHGGSYGGSRARDRGHGGTGSGPVTMVYLAVPLSRCSSWPPGCASTWTGARPGARRGRPRPRGRVPTAEPSSEELRSLGSTAVRASATHGTRRGVEVSGPPRRLGPCLPRRPVHRPPRLARPTPAPNSRPSSTPWTSSWTRSSFPGCRALEEGRGVLVAAPTGAGRSPWWGSSPTWPCGRGRRRSTPRPSRRCRRPEVPRVLHRWGSERVGLLTGDTSVNSEADVVAMTTEVLRNMLYGGSATTRNLGFVGHGRGPALADRFRGAVWEGSSSTSRSTCSWCRCPPPVSNAEEFRRVTGADVRGGQEDVVVSPSTARSRSGSTCR